ncbi:MAG: trypsin-like serine peptidase [Micromonosporaceae bacterium]
MWVRGRMRFPGAAAIAAGLLASGMAGDGYAGARTSAPTADRTAAERAASTDPVTTGRGDGRDSGDEAGTTPGEPSGGQPEPVGVTETVDAVLGDAGERTHRLHFPGARYVKVHFSELDVLPGDRVTVADPTGNEVHTYRADPALASLPGDSPVTYDESGGFWAMSVSGDTAVVKLERAPGVDRLMTRRNVVIDKVARGLLAAETPARGGDAPRAPAGPGSEESTCGNDDAEDAVCYESDYPTEYAHSRPVARLLIDGTSLCTAWRIGPNNRLLTNHHCFRDSAAARGTEVWFDYECTDCGDATTTTPIKVAGSSVLATNRGLDYTLFTVSDFDEIQEFGYLELETRIAEDGEELYIPQHPGGDPKQISLHSDVDETGACVVDEPSYDGYFAGSDTSYYCDTAPGSSGSPVLSRRTHKVVALHHFGGCPNSGVRGDRLYRALRGRL